MTGRSHGRGVTLHSRMKVLNHTASSNGVLKEHRELRALILSLGHSLAKLSPSYLLGLPQVPIFLYALEISLIQVISLSIVLNQFVMVGCDALSCLT